MPTTREPPSGKVTFLVTDIEGSSRLSDRLWGASYSKAVLQQPFERMREVSHAHQGYVFKDSGDGLLIAFDEAADALECAISLQEWFASPGIQVTDNAGKSARVAIRVGIHTAEEDLFPELAFDEGGGADYKDKHVNVASRIAAIGVGSQIFVSDSTQRRLAGIGSLKWKRRRAHLRNLYSVDRSSRLREKISSVVFGRTIWECLWDGKSRGEPNKYSRRKGRAIASAGAMVVLGLGVVFALLGREKNQRKVDSVVTKGIEGMERGDKMTALLWFAEALRLERGNVAHQAVHRMRVKSILRELPELIQVWNFEKNVNQAIFGPDSKWVAIAAAEGVQVWNVSNAQPVSPIMRHESQVLSLNFSPDGRSIVTAAWDGSARVWNAETGDPLTPVMKHDEHLSNAIFGPEGKSVATTSWDGTARLWETGSGKPLTEPLRVGHGPQRPQFSSSGRWLITPSLSSNAWVWDVRTGRVVACLTNQGAEYAEFSPDDTRVLVAGFNSFRLWETAMWTAITPEIQFGAVEEARFSPDGKMVVICSAGAAIIYDISNTQSGPKMLKFNGSTTSVAFAPNSSLIAIGSSNSGKPWGGLSSATKGEVNLWDTRTGEPITPPLTQDAGITSVEFSADGSCLLAASSAQYAIGEKDKEHRAIVGWSASYSTVSKGQVRIWALPKREPLAVIKQHSAIREAIFSRDGQYIATASDDGMVRVFDARTYHEIGTPLGHQGSVTLVAFSRDSLHLAAACTNGMVMVWNVQSGSLVARLGTQSAEIIHGGFSSDGQRLFAIDKNGEARSWITRTGQQLFTAKVGSNIFTSGSFSSDGKRIASLGRNDEIQIWDAENGQLLQTVNHEGRVRIIQFSSNGDRLATASIEGIPRKGQVLIWDVRTGNRITSLPAQEFETETVEFTSIQFSGDARRLVTACADFRKRVAGEARIWDTKTGNPLTPAMRVSRHLEYVNFSPDGRFAVTSGNGTLRLWDSWTGQPVTPELPHPGSVNIVRFSPVGLRVLTGCGEKSLYLWDFSSDWQSVEGLLNSVKLITGQKMDEIGNATSLSRDEFAQTWKRVRIRPGSGTPKTTH